MNNTHGGKRNGAGRKASDGVVLVCELNVSVDQLSLDLIMQYGGGNTSLGIRKICAALSAKSTTPVRLKSVAKKKPAPVYIEPDEFTPEGSRRNLLTMRRLRAEAQEQYEQALAEYVEE